MRNTIGATLFFAGLAVRGIGAFGLYIVPVLVPIVGIALIH